MGLDTVELVLEVEEAFDVKILDEDASRMTTVGELWDYLQARAVMSRPEACATRSAFYSLRRGMMQAIGIPRDWIAPATDLRSLMPKNARRKIWSQLSCKTRLKLPELSIAPWLKRCLDAGAWAGAAAAAAGIWRIGWPLTAGLTVPVAGLALALLLDRLATPWKTGFNSDWSTIGGLTRAAVGLNPDAWRPEQSQSAEVLWERLRALISRQLGVPLDMVKPGARFVQDLGAG